MKQNRKNLAGLSPRPSVANRISSWLEASPWRGTALLLSFTWILWGRTIGFRLHYWDDFVYLFQDPRLEGLTRTHLRAILAKPFFANYHPITTLTFLLDRSLWGQWIPGYHLTHLLFYSVGVVLVYEFFCRVLGDRFWALFGAALYSTHTLHVEPVAWLACRKDVVCLAFYAAALLVYERYAGRRDRAMEAGEAWPWRDYLLLAFFTALALGSKGYAAVLPFVFLARDLCSSPRLNRRQWLDKIPLFALAGGLALITVHAQDTSSALLKDMSALGGLTAAGRIDVLLKIFSLYVGRSLLPLSLNANYLVGSGDWYPEWGAVLGLFLLVAILAGFFRLRRSSPAPAYALALFALPLATTMNTFFTLRLWMTDRYLLMPTIGSVLFFAWAGKTLQDRRPEPRRANRVAAWAFMVLALYAGLTVARTRVWSSLIWLRSDTLRKNSDFLSGDGPVSAAEFVSKSSGHSSPRVLLDYIDDLVVAYEKEGRQDEADAFRGILRGVGRGGRDQATAAMNAGRPQEAIPLLTAVVEKGEWGDEAAADELGDAYAKSGQPEKARQWYQQSFMLHKKRGLSGAAPLVNKMALEFKLKNYPQALETLRLLEKEAPGDPRGYIFEGRALEEMGRLEQAYPCYEKAEKLPDSAYAGTQLTPADLQRQMGSTAQKLGKTGEMRKHYARCLRLNPDDPQRAAIEKILAQPHG